MIVHLLKIIFIVFFASSNIAYASWTGFTLDSISSPLPSPMNTDITNNTIPVYLNSTISLGPQDPSIPLYSFTNKTGATINSFSLILACMPYGFLANCDAGQAFGAGIGITSNVFLSNSGNGPATLIGGTGMIGDLDIWKITFSNGNLLNNSAVAMFNQFPTTDPSPINPIDYQNSFIRPPRILVAIPEPSSTSLIILGLICLIFIYCRRNSSCSGFKYRVQHWVN
jgi:hypothetical protein